MTAIQATASEEELRRLSIVRHLYDLGSRQANGPDPTSSLAILMFHDSAEMFLQLCCEHFNISESKTDFVKHWDLLSKVQVILPEKGSMSRLNAARRGLKHQGILPSGTELSGFQASVTNFLYDSSMLVFGVAFEEIRLTHLIRFLPARKKLDEAYIALGEGKLANALECAAIAFRFVRRAHRSSHVDPTTGRSMVQLGCYIDPLRFSTFGGLANQMTRQLERLSEQTQGAVDALSEAVEMLAYRIDLTSYRLFKTYTPYVHEFPGSDQFTIDWFGNATSDRNAVLETIQFVVDAAVKFRV